MAAQVTDIRAPGQIDFSTTDGGLATDYLQSAYHVSARFSGIRDGAAYSHSRLAAGSFAIDELRMSNMRVAVEPFNSLIVATLRTGKFERECAGVDERFVDGDVFIIAEPSRPATIRWMDMQCQGVMLDLSVLAQVAATSPARAPCPIRFTGFKPVSTAATADFKKVATFLAELLTNADAASNPLIHGSAARLLAATALTTFPNSALIEPTAQDRIDATSATVRRAVAFMEQRPNADISVADIAAAAHVGIRAVQVAFRRHLNTTPMQHLRTIRLDRVHREFLATDPASGRTVTDIAARWGFYNHSRFARSYRRAYGINPRDSLRGT